MQTDKLILAHNGHGLLTLMDYYGNEDSGYELLDFETNYLETEEGHLVSFQAFILAIIQSDEITLPYELGLFIKKVEEKEIGFEEYDTWIPILTSWEIKAEVQNESET